MKYATFWVCLGLIAYTYFIYPLILVCAYAGAQAWRDWQYLILRRNRRCTSPDDKSLPPVSLVVSAFDEEAHLQEKITNIRQLDYPHGKLEVIFVSDGSTDRTNEILQNIRDPRINAIFLTVRSGKATALNHGISKAKHDILVLSDAATLFAPDALKKLVRHFFDPEIGVVCGALQLKGTSESENTEGVYWKYESALRLMEGRLGATLGASGAIYAVRRECHQPLAANNLVDDFAIPMYARRKGYRVAYDPEAVATDFSASTVAGEFTRRIRLAVGSFLTLREIARISLGNFTSLAFFSHKVLRWFLPFLLIGLLLSSSFLWNEPFYRAVLIGQMIFYLWALAGFFFRNRIQKVRYALLGYFLLAIHVAFLVGFVRVLLGREEGVWQRVH